MKTTLHTQPHTDRRASNRTRLLLPPFYAGLIAFLSLLQVHPASVQAAINCATPPDGLVGWWPAEDHTYDIIGKRFGVLNGDATYAAGQVGRAFSFGGTGGRARVLESTANDLSRLPRWTIEAWVRPTSFGNATYPTIYSEGNRIVTLGINNGTGRLESWVNNDSSRRLFSTNALALNDWNHVALVYEGGRRLLYLNGVLDGSTNTPAITDDSSGASIGQSTANDAATVFQGAVDELSLYNTNLTAAQIATIHTAGPAGKCFNESAAPTFVLDPVSQNAFLGDTVTLTALAAGRPDISYQWLLNGTPINGATGYSFTLSNLTFANAGAYSLRATNPFGSTTSTVAQIIVPFCTPTTNLAAWWPADGSGLDSTTNHHDGAVWGGTTFGPGVTGTAFCFDGTNSYAAVPDAPALSPHVGTNGEMTIEAWVRLDQLPQTDAVTGQNRRTILAKGGPGQWEYGLSITTTGIPEFYLWTPAGAVAAGVTGGQIIAGEWHHIVATAKKGDALQLYQDSQLVGTSTNFTGDTAAGSSPLYIGRRGDAQFLKGWVDEAALYSRALTAAEITALYAASESGKCSGAPGPAPWFTRQPENQTGYLLLGAGLAAFANGTPRPSYQWYRSNATEWAIMPDQTNGTLAFTNLSEEVEGNYRVIATNPRGTQTSASAYLRVSTHDLLTGGETFEKGWNGWDTDGSVWEVGTHGSNGVAATVLAGSYPAYAQTRLTSPPMDLPAVAAGEELQLRIEHWYDYSSYDSGTVQISMFNPTNGQWGGWVDLANFAGYSVVWSRAHMDLGAFAGRRVRLGFHHSSTRSPNSSYVSEADGWYIDNVEVWKGVPQVYNPETFAAGQGDWSVDQGTWEFGTNGGRSVLATVLNGDYYAYSSSRAVSPPMDLPNVAAGEELQLCHWEAYSYAAYDSGTLQISIFDSLAGQWGAWSNLRQVTGRSSGWNRACVDLIQFAGRRVRLAFHHSSTRSPNSSYVSEDDGWRISDLFIKRGNLAVSAISDKAVNEHATLTFPVTVIGTTPDSCVSYQLIDPPKGATIDPTTGVFSWTPEECQGPGIYNIGIYVVDFCNNEANDLGFVKVTINEVNQPPWLLAAEGTVYVGRTNVITLCSGDPDCPRNPLTYSLLDAVPPGMTISASDGEVRWAPTLAQLGTYTNRIRLCDGGSPNYCVTNTIVVSVTTNEYALEIQQITADDVRFILHGGSLAVDYILQQATDLCGCPCNTVWEDVGRVVPTEMPYAFERSMDRRYRFFRLRGTPRTP